jgi:Ca2+-binding EF-hand superfamily protein
MKRAILGCLVLTAIFACLVGPALGQIPASRDWKESFRAHDKNGDGRVDRAEFQEWMVDVFFHMDKNHKGYLVFGDVQDVMSINTFKTYDKNGDGKITLQEYLNDVFKDFDAADVNKNGALTMEEIDVYVKRTGK